MDALKPYIENALKIWRESSPTSRIGIVLLAAICAIAIGAVGYWSVQPNYVVLVSGSQTEKIDKVIDSLDASGIEYDLSGAGGNLLVDKRDFAKASLLTRNAGVELSEQSGVPSLGSTFGSPSDRRNMARQQKERKIAATIQRINVVEHADVHLSLPDKGPFERETSDPSASVLLTLKPSARLRDDQANSIANFVAHAVENLSPENVQITDREGRSYSVGGDQTKEISSQVEYVSELERKLAQKAETQLIHFLGFGNASVEVSLDMTFTQGSTTSVKYDPEGKVASTENLHTNSTKNIEEPAVGATGVASNLRTRKRDGGNVESKEEEINTTYLVPKTELTQADSTPVRNFMTVSVLVNSNAPNVQDEEGAILPNLQEQVMAIVKNAVGFRSTNDQISVEFLKFPEADLSADVVATPFDWVKIIGIVEKASLAIAAVLAFILGFMMLRKIQPVSDSDEISETSQLDPQRLDNVNQLSNLIKDHPDVFREIVRSWSGSEKTEEPAAQKAA